MRYLFILHIYSQNARNIFNIFIVLVKRFRNDTSMRFYTLTAVLLFFVLVVKAQQNYSSKLNASEVLESIKKLNVLGSVLYVAAHPDDENQRLISYMVSERKMQTAYLSLTRGDGGQNLIGSELREMLGVLRTQELLAARSIDGGKQMFTRANDFGFSKTPTETLKFWNKKEVLSDVVWAIRKWQPDVIINRFSTDTTIETHGHHTSSAILSKEAFDLAADPNIFPEQLKYVSVWQPKRLFFNTSWFFYGSREAFDKSPKTNLVSADLGVYYPWKGKSNNEIAAEARSMHRCQGFGGASQRGSDIEYFDYLKGIGKPKTDVFEGINTSWSRVEGGEKIGTAIDAAIKAYNLNTPSASVPALIKILEQIENLPEGHWKTIKLIEVKEIIRACCGLYFEASSATASGVANQKIEVTAEVTNRSDLNVKLERIELLGLGVDSTFGKNLANNARAQIKLIGKIPADAQTTAPYWLRNVSSLGMYTVNDQTLRGLPETPRTIYAQFDVTILDKKISYFYDVANKFENPARGEQWSPFEITPVVFVNIPEKVYIFADSAKRTVQFTIRAGADNVEGALEPKLPNNWKIEPLRKTFSLKQKGEEVTLTFLLTAPEKSEEATMAAQVLMIPSGKLQDNLKFDYQPIETKSVKTIAYDHTPTQTVLLPAEAKIIKLDLKKSGKNIGYFMGAGDDMPACLEQIGYNVTQLTNANFQSLEGLKGFDAIVLGIRAYNTKEKLAFFNTTLLDYAKNGGTVVVQYNTSGRDLVTQKIGPYPFKISRDRTTEEDAIVTFLKPEHVALNKPNKISAKDFDGWVQERGLYFLIDLDPQYEQLISCHDINENPRDGGLVVTKYGKGWYVYTGYSFFRQMPAGVSGAYRLFTNLISLPK